MEPLNIGRDERFGSGYDDLRGMVINYGYDGFDDFHLAVNNGRYTWQGQKLYFDGISTVVFPVVSRCADGIYFSSWPIGPAASDNVVVNFNTMTVNAHLHPEDNEVMAMEMIHGPVTSVNEPDTAFPHCELTPVEEIYPRIEANMAAKDLPPLFDPDANNRARFEEDVAARRELAGVEIAYRTRSTHYRLTVDGEVTTVTKDDGDPVEYQTYATKIADAVFFLSWAEGSPGKHIIVNADSGNVFDNLTEAGERTEGIFALLQFGEAATP